MCILRCTRCGEELGGLLLSSHLYECWLRRARNEWCLYMPDGIMYWEDGAETLAAFVEAFPPGAGLLMQSKGAVIVQLASVHDNLLPDVNASLARLSSAVTLPVSAVPHSVSQSAPFYEHVCGGGYTTHAVCMAC